VGCLAQGYEVGGATGGDLGRLPCGNDNRRALGEAGDHVARDGCSA
jgi:hypothetical protein